MPEPIAACPAMDGPYVIRRSQWHHAGSGTCRSQDAHPAREASMKVLKSAFFLLFGILLGTGLSGL